MAGRAITGQDGYGKKRKEEVLQEKKRNETKRKQQNARLYQGRGDRVGKGLRGGWGGLGGVGGAWGGKGKGGGGDVVVSCMVVRRT